MAEYILEKPILRLKNLIEALLFLLPIRYPARKW